MKFLTLSTILCCLIFSFIIGGCFHQNNFLPDQIIKSSDCENISVEKDVIGSQSYCLTSMEKLKNLYRNDALAYVGSNEKFHFFYWYVKRLYYQSQPQGFAVPRSEYMPKEEFYVRKNRIGECPFINSAQQVNPAESQGGTRVQN